MSAIRRRRAKSVTFPLAHNSKAMKILVQLLGLGLLLFGQPRFLPAQTPDSDCQDIIRLQNGDILRGQIQEILGEGQFVVFRTWSGVVFDLRKTQIRRITQRCKDVKIVRKAPPLAYSFNKKGWYHHTRAGMLVGQSYAGENKQGLLFQHSSGKMFNRMFGIGLGAGMESFNPGSNDAVTYPIFAELQGFLLPRKITPFYNLAGGWAFSGRSINNGRWGLEDRWKGGWMAQAGVGYRIGNHFTVQVGVRLQHKRREWTSIWGPESGSGEDRILHKRLILAVGLLL